MTKQQRHRKPTHPVYTAIALAPQGSSFITYQHLDVSLYLCIYEIVAAVCLHNTCISIVLVHSTAVQSHFLDGPLPPGRPEARKIRTPQVFFRREGVTGGDPASGDSARGAYWTRAPGRSDLTGSVTKGLRAQRIASIHLLDSRV